MKKRSSKIIRINTYEDDLNYSMQVIRIILGIIGAWPIPIFSPRVNKIVVRLQNILSCSLLLFIVIPSCLLLIVENHSFQKILKIIGPAINAFSNFMKYILILSHTKNIQNCIEQIRQNWKNIVNCDDRIIMLSKAKVSRRLAIISAMVGYIGGLSYRTFVPIIKGRMLTPMNTTVRMMVCYSYLGSLDQQATPAYEIILSLQFFAGVVTYSIISGITGLFALFIMHICGQMNILMKKLQLLNDIAEPNDRTVIILLADIVEYQIKIKSFLKEIERIMQGVFFVDIIGSTLLICIAGYYIIVHWQDRNFEAMIAISILVTCFCLCLYINCYVGQLLTDQSAEVQLMITTLNWYRLPFKQARGLILLMAISANSTKFYAGKIVELSLPTFGNIMKTSLAYLNMILNFM